LVSFAILFEDKPGQGALRAERLSAHIEWIASHPEVIGRVTGNRARSQAARAAHAARVARVEHLSARAAPEGAARGAPKSPVRQ